MRRVKAGELFVEAEGRNGKNEAKDHHRVYPGGIMTGN